MRTQFLQSPRLADFGRRGGGGAPVDPLAPYAVGGITPALVADFENGLYLGTLSAYADLTVTGSPVFDTVVGSQRLRIVSGTDTVVIPAALLPSGTTFSFAMSGEITYADDNSENFSFYRWQFDASNYVRARFTTVGSQTGRVNFRQRQSASGIDDVGSPIEAYSPGTDVPFAIASRHGDTFLNGAVDGTALGENTTTTVLFDGSGSDIDLGFRHAGTAVTLRLRRFIMWNADIGNTGVAEASVPFDLGVGNGVFTFDSHRVHAAGGDLVFIGA